LLALLAVEGLVSIILYPRWRSLANGFWGSSGFGKASGFSPVSRPTKPKGLAPDGVETFSLQWHEVADFSHKLLSGPQTMITFPLL
jgi:hypothetical protein